MKNLSYAFGIVAILSTPVHAADLCREEAKAMGYISALEMLAPCEQSVAAPTEPSHEDEDRRQAELKSKPESQAATQVDVNFVR